jgi:DNA-binding transcriptional regulator YiaG
MTDFQTGHFNHSQYLKDWRRGLDITQAKAAELLRTPLRSYQKWELGRPSPTIIITACMAVTKEAEDA